MAFVVSVFCHGCTAVWAVRMILHLLQLASSCFCAWWIELQFLCSSTKEITAEKNAVAELWSYEINTEWIEGVSKMIPEKNVILHALSSVVICHKVENCSWESRNSIRLHCLKQTQTRGMSQSSPASDTLRGCPQDYRMWCRASLLNTKWDHSLSSWEWYHVLGRLSMECYGQGTNSGGDAGMVSRDMSELQTFHHGLANGRANTLEKMKEQQKGILTDITTIIFTPLLCWGGKERCQEQRREVEFEERQGDRKVLLFSFLYFLLTKSANTLN